MPDIVLWTDMLPVLMEIKVEKENLSLNMVEYLDLLKSLVEI